MSGTHLFGFVNTISEDLYTLTKDIEASLFSQPQSVLIQARLYTENLMKIVSKQEELEKVVPLKHVERIYRLYRQNAVEGEIYAKLEWVRKKGNKAAHDIHAATYEDGFKAHRYLFDISVWYMQVYGSYDFEAPIYKLPEPKHKESELSEEKVKELVQPFVEQSFHQMDEMKRELQNQLEEIKKERDALSKSEEADSEKFEQEENSEEEFFLFKYLDEEGMEYVDKRDKNGALWIIGDWSIKDKLFALKQRHLYFRFAKKGGRATNNQPAWFLLNKNFQEKPEDYKQLEKEETNKENSDIVSKDVEAPEDTMVSFSVSLEVLEARDWVSNGQLRMPHHLEKVTLYQTFDPILSNLTGCSTFGDITEEKLREVYKESKESFLNTVEALFFWGVRFTGNLEKFQPTTQGSDRYIIRVHNAGGKKIRDIASVKEAKKLENRNITNVETLDKILLDSLNWLTGTNNNWVEEKSEKPAEKTSESKEDTMLHYKMEKMRIPAVIAEKSLWRIGVEGCDNLLRQFNNLGVKKLEDIDFSLDNVHEKMSQTGEKTIKKFWHQLQQIAGEKQEIDKVNKVDGIEGNIIYFDREKIKVPENLKDVELNGAFFSGAENAVEQLKASGTKTLGDLPSDFITVRKIKGVGNKKVEIIFKHLSNFIQEEEKRKELENLSPEEYKKHLFQQLMARLDNAMENEEAAKKEKIPTRYFYLTKKRYHASLRGEHLTLEELGNELGMTREGVRQIFAKGDARIATLVQPFIDFVLHNEQKSKKMFVEDYLHTHSLLHYIILQGIEKLGLTTVASSEKVYISRLDEHELRGMKEEIKKELKETFHLRVINFQKLREYCEEKAVEVGCSVEFIKRVAEGEVNWLAEDQGILKSISKKDVVEMVMLQYPEGAEIYGQEEELIEKANDFMPGQFKGERSFNSIALREDVASSILLWDRGIYIHENFITVNQSILNRAIQMAVNLVKKNGSVKVTKVYENFEEELKEQGIMSEYALYSLMRKQGNEYLSFSKFPTIHPVGEERKSNGEYIREYLENNGGNATISELENEFLSNRGWKKFSLSQALAKNKEIVVLDREEYGLLSDYSHIKPEDLQFVADQITDKLEESPVAFIDAFYQENELVLRSLRITSRRLLYSLLKEMFGDVLKMGRFPYILKKGIEINNVFGNRLIDDYIKKEEDIVSREEVEQWITDMLGENDRYLDAVLGHSSTILYYAQGEYGEYVHADTIGYGPKMKEDLERSVTNLFEKISKMRNRDYVFIDELIDEESLPPLKNQIEWSEDLLRHLLKKSDRWNLIGSYDAIVTPVYSSISSDAKFIEYLLQKEFSGSAKLNSFKKYLNDIKYSNGGKLLAETEVLLEEGEAPFQLDGDEILLKDWSDVSL
ncbi:hypothetical protein [Salimicrobium humidisoli]|uniref:Uncharacterized protein n=1 Tax=Salimicrobium humidisoli TaxID=2029857 RepID=A0ABX4HVJ0_9BACI|nr:hypothetical protein [Salimicrobium humidisoli]PBB06945.1 hypothetical protein CKW00_00355 [Salimicrobium humidisoli]